MPHKHFAYICPLNVVECISHNSCKLVTFIPKILVEMLDKEWYNLIFAWIADILPIADINISPKLNNNHVVTDSFSNTQNDNQSSSTILLKQHERTTTVSRMIMWSAVNLWGEQIQGTIKHHQLCWALHVEQAAFHPLRSAHGEPRLLVLAATSTPVRSGSTSSLTPPYPPFISLAVVMDSQDMKS